MSDKQITAEILAHPRGVEQRGQYVRINGTVYQLGAFDKERQVYDLSIATPPPGFTFSELFDRHRSAPS